MARGSLLSDYEKGKISVYKEYGMSNRSIAIKMNRSKAVVNDFWPILSYMDANVLEVSQGN